jgi:hypothetical protein
MHDASNEADTKSRRENFPFSHLIAAVNAEELKEIIETNLDRLVYMCKIDLLLILERHRHILEQQSLTTLLSKLEERVAEEQRKKREKQEMIRSRAMRSVQEFAVNKIFIAQCFEVVRISNSSISVLDIVAKVKRRFNICLSDSSIGYFHFQSVGRAIGGPRDLVIEQGHVLFLSHCRKRGLPVCILQAIFRFALPICSIRSAFISQTEVRRCVDRVQEYWTRHRLNCQQH